MVSTLKIIDKSVSLVGEGDWKFSFIKLYKTVGDNYSITNYTFLQ